MCGHILRVSELSHASVCTLHDQAGFIFYPMKTASLWFLLQLQFLSHTNMPFYWIFFTLWLRLQPYNLFLFSHTNSQIVGSFCDIHTCNSDTRQNNNPVQPHDITHIRSEAISHTSMYGYVTRMVWVQEMCPSHPQQVSAVTVIAASRWLDIERGLPRSPQRQPSDGLLWLYAY